MNVRKQKHDLVRVLNEYQFSGINIDGLEGPKTGVLQNAAGIHQDQGIVIYDESERSAIIYWSVHENMNTQTQIWFPG